MFLSFAVALSWPLILNNGPIFFNDSVPYLSAGRAAWTAVDRAGSAVPASKPVEAGAAVTQGHPTGGRSPYYGAAAWGARSVAGIDAVAVLQILWLSLALTLALPRLGIAGRAEQLGTVAILAACTSLPFFAATILPDVFGGLAILAVALLWTVRREMDRVEQGFWLVSLLMPMLFHRSFLLLGVGLVAAALLLSRLPLRARLASAWPLAAVLVVAVAGNLLIGIAAARVGGRDITPIPFLLARVIGDGTGAQVLREECPHTAYATCRFLDYLPLTENGFLWGDGTTVQPWARLDTPTRALISREEPVIVAHALAHHPLRQLLQSTGNVVSQVFAFDLREFEADHPLSLTLSRDPGLAAESANYHHDAIWVERLSLLPVSIYWGLLSGLAVVAAAVGLLFRRRLAPSVLPQVIAVVALLLAGVVLNAAINGALAGVMGRYMSRVAWLPVLAVAALAMPAVRSWFAANAAAARGAARATGIAVMVLGSGALAVALAGGRPGAATGAEVPSDLP